MTHSVLVVEDDDVVRQFMEQVLEKSGYEIHSVVDGVEAVQRLALNRYDAVVLDVIMPRMDGFGVLRYLETSHPSVLPTVLIATGNPRDAAKLELREICRVLVKPFDAARLLDAVRECVTVASARDAALPAEGRSSN